MPHPVPALQPELWVLAQNAAGYSHPCSARSFLLARSCLCHPSLGTPGRCLQGAVPRPLGVFGDVAGTACGEQGRLGLCPGGFRQHPKVPSAHSSVPLMQPRPPITSGIPTWQQLPDKHPGFGFPALGQGWQGATGDSYPCTQLCEHPQKVSLPMHAKHFPLFQIAHGKLCLC